jgi:predicted dehydrogenase
MSKKIRYGIIGFGRFAETTMLPAFSESQNSEVIAIQNRNLKKAKEKADEYNFKFAFDSAKELVSNPEVDVVYIASPVFMHVNDAITAAQSDKHILLEKPIAMNKSEAEKIIEASKKNNVKLMVAQMARFSPVNIRIKELIKSGAIGKITFIKTEYFYDVRMSKRWWSRDTKMAGGGPTFDIGVHCLDTMRFILDDDVISVKSQLSPIINEEKTEMTSITALKFSKGIPGSIFCSFEVPYARILIEVVGEDGIISAKNFTISKTSVKLKIMKGKDGKTSETITEDIEVPNIYEKEITHFSDCIINDSEPSIPGEEGLKNQIVLDEAIKN